MPVEARATSSDGSFMVHGSWFMVHGSWFMVLPPLPSTSSASQTERAHPSISISISTSKGSHPGYLHLPYAPYHYACTTADAHQHAHAAWRPIHICNAVCMQVQVPTHSTAQHSTAKLDIDDHAVRTMRVTRQLRMQEHHRLFSSHRDPGQYIVHARYGVGRPGYNSSPSPITHHPTPSRPQRAPPPF